MNFVQHTDAAVDLNLRPCPKVPANGAHEGHGHAPASSPSEAGGDPDHHSQATPSAKQLRVRVPAFFVLHNGRRSGRLH